MKKILLALLVLLSSVSMAKADDIRVAEISVQDLAFQTQKEIEKGGYKYTNEWEDEKIGIELRFSWYGFPIRIKNKTGSIARLIWDNSVYIGPDTRSLRIIPGNTRVIHSEQTVPASVLPPRAQYNTYLVVQGYGLPDESRSSTILSFPANAFFGVPTSIQSKRTKAYAAFADKYKGQKVTLLLCFEIEKQEQYYQFDLNLDFIEGIKNLPQVDEHGNEIERLNIGWELEENSIIAIEKNGIAEKAGLLAGDTIVEINLSPADTVKNIDDYCLEKLEVGSSVMLLCDRNGESVLITLKRPSK